MDSRILRRVVLLMPLGAGCGMSVDYRDTDAEVVEPACLVLDPSEVDFGYVDLGQALEQRVTLWNRCESTVVLDLAWGGDVGAFSLVSDDAPLVVFPGSVELVLQFAPVHALAHDASMALLSGNQVLARLALKGFADGPELVLDPATLDIDVESVGCTYEGVLTVRNQGNSALTVSELVVDPDRDPLRVGIDHLGPGPWELGPSQRMELPVTYRPLDAATDRVEVELRTDVPGHERPVIELLGHAASPGQGHDELEQVGPHVSQLVVFMQRDLGAASPAHVIDALAFGAREAYEADTAGHRITVITRADGCVAGPTLAVDDSTAPGDVRPTLERQVDQGAVDGPSADGADLLDLAALALGSRTGAGECNEGLLHEDGYLDVVFVADRAAAAPFEDAVAALGDLVPDSSTLRVHAMVGDGVCADAELGAGYLDAQGAYGGRSAPICAADATDFFRAIAHSNVLWHDRLPLSQPAVAQRLSVTVQGDEWLTGWRYDAPTTSVVFEDVRPPRGALIEADYTVQGPCASDR